MVEESISFRIANQLIRMFGVQLSPIVQAEPTGDTPEPRARRDANTIGRVMEPWDELLSIGRSRRRRYEEYEQMDEGDMEAQLDAMVNSVLVSDDGSFQGFRVNTGAKYGNVIGDMVERLDLPWTCREVLRDTLKIGDEFEEILIDDDFNIVRLQSVPAAETYVNVDRHNRLLGGFGTFTNLDGGIFPGQRQARLPRAYHQLNDAMQIVAAWLPWEMCHLKWRSSTKKTYSVGSYLEAMRRPWHGLRMMEQGMIVARIIRAYTRNVHYLDQTGKSPEEAEAELKGYIDEVTKKKTSGGNLLQRPLAVDEDIYMGTGYIDTGEEFLPKLTKIETLDPSSRGLGNIGDIEYHQRKLFPYMSKGVVGIEAPSDEMTAQDVASSKMVQYCQKGILERQLIWPLIRLQLLLKGYKPVRSDIEIEWPEVVVRQSWRWSDGSFRRAMAWRNHVEMGTASRRYVAQTELGMSDDEWKRVEQEVKDEAASMPEIPQGSQAAQTSQGNRSA